MNCTKSRKKIKNGERKTQWDLWVSWSWLMGPISLSRTDILLHLQRPPALSRPSDPLWASTRRWAGGASRVPSVTAFPGEARSLAHCGSWEANMGLRHPEAASCIWGPPGTAGNICAKQLASGQQLPSLFPNNHLSLLLFQQKGHQLVPWSRGLNTWKNFCSLQSELFLWVSLFKQQLIWKQLASCSLPWGVARLGGLSGWIN